MLRAAEHEPLFYHFMPYRLPILKRHVLLDVGVQA